MLLNFDYLFTRSPHPIYSIIINNGCLIVQQPKMLTTLGCFPTFFIVAISLRNSSSSSAVGFSEKDFSKKY